MMNSKNVLFYTSATKQYINFIPLYSYFASKSNPNALFEFIVDDAVFAEKKLEKSLSFLRNECGISITIRGHDDFSGKVKVENTLRFILEPKERADFVYIGDIDIMIVENVYDVHKKIFESGFPYSNTIRANSKKLTGLHFTRYDDYYPLGDIEDIACLDAWDEEILYKIVERSGHLAHQSAIDSMGVGRPQHGIHMSLNRIPFSSSEMRVDWGVTWNYAYLTSKIVNEEEFLSFARSLNHQSRMLIANIYYLANGIINSGKEIYSIFTDPEHSSSVMERMFSKIYKENLWKGAESLSGPSSGLMRTQTLRSELPGIIEKYNIQTFFDAPCGDFYWMKELIPNLSLKYIGGDIVDHVIEENNRRFSSGRIEFFKIDLTIDQLPSADILFCRDFLFHMSYKDIASVFSNYLRSGIKFFMTTSHVNNDGFLNKDIATGGWRYIDLFADPFCFSENYLEKVIDGGGDRYMYLWDIKQIEPSLQLAIERLESDRP